MRLALFSFHFDILFVVSCFCSVKFLWKREQTSAELFHSISIRVLTDWLYVFVIVPLHSHSHPPVCATSDTHSDHSKIMLISFEWSFRSVCITHIARSSPQNVRYLCSLPFTPINLHIKHFCGIKFMDFHTEPAFVAHTQRGNPHAVNWENSRKNKNESAFNLEEF